MVAESLKNVHLMAMLQCYPSYQLHVPQNAENGDPGEFRVGVEFPQNPWSGNSKFVLGTPFWDLVGILETFLAGALYREFREFMRTLTTFLGKTHRNPS